MRIMWFEKNKFLPVVMTKLKNVDVVLDISGAREIKLSDSPTISNHQDSDYVRFCPPARQAGELSIFDLQQTPYDLSQMGKRK